MNRDVRTVVQWVLREWPGRAIPDSVHVAATRLAKPKRRPAKQLAPGKTKAQRRDERRKQIADLREAVMVRADGTCELCETLPTAEVHHLLSGGLRRHREDLSTLVAVCAECHRDYHRGDIQTLSLALDWAHRNGFWAAAGAITKRLAKIEEARASSAPGRER